MSYSLKELKNRLQEKNVDVSFEGDLSAVIGGVADLESATRDEISFLANPHYEAAMRASHAGCIVIAPDIERPVGRNYFITKEPSLTFQTLIELFMANSPPLTRFEGIHKTAVIHDTAKLASGVTLGPYAVIDANVTIGRGSIISAHTFVGPDSVIGDECIIHANVTIREGSILGNRVVIQPGAIIGSCGFGFSTDAKGQHTKLNQLGKVVIEDDVEIGANSTIDRARFQMTRIGRGTKIDNLVQIGHGVRVGMHNLIIAQTGIAGSTETGSHVVLAGQVAVNGHIKLASGVIVTARSGVSKSLLKAGKYGGVPAMPLHESNKIGVLLHKLPEIALEVKAMKKQLLELTEQQKGQ